MNNSVGVRITNSIINGIGIASAIAFMVLFIIKSNSALEIIFYTIFCSLLIICYLYKVLYYSLNKGTGRTIMKVIARNTFTLVLYFLLLIINLTYIKGVMGWLIFSLFIPITIIGIVFNSIFYKNTSYIWIIMNTLLCLGSLSVIKGIIITRTYISFILFGIILALGLLSFITSRINKNSFSIVSNSLILLSLISINLFLLLYII